MAKGKGSVEVTANDITQTVTFDISIINPKIAEDMNQGMSLKKSLKKHDLNTKTYYEAIERAVIHSVGAPFQLKKIK